MEVMVSDELKSYFKDKKVLVTGHTGFKGTWLLWMLDIMGAKVAGYSLAPKSKLDLFNITRAQDRCNSHIGDIRDRASFKKVILDFQPDFIFHMAAQPLVRYSYEFPEETYETNVMGTVNLLSILRELNKKCVVVVITTDKVYQNAELGREFAEGDKLGGHDPYSSSKACTELAAESFRDSFFNFKHFQDHQKSISTVRSGNVIGGGDWSLDRIIPDVVRALINNTVIEVRNPKSVRPWQFVLDPLYGYLILAANQADSPIEFSQAFNFGPMPNDTLTVEQLVNSCIEIWGEGKMENAGTANQPHESELLKLNIKKATSKLKWEPAFDSKTTVHATISWYQAFNNKENMMEFTKNQINNYLNLRNGK